MRNKFWCHVDPTKFPTGHGYVCRPTTNHSHHRVLRFLLIFCCCHFYESQKLSLSLTMILRYLSDQLQHLVLSVLAAGPIPRHVAFVMDGNRRYARMHSMQVKQGHIDGFGALRKVKHAASLVYSIQPTNVIHIPLLSTFILEATRSLPQAADPLCFSLCFRDRQFQAYT